MHSLHRHPNVERPHKIWCYPFLLAIFWSNLLINAFFVAAVTYPLQPFLWTSLQVSAIDIFMVPAKK